MKSENAIESYKCLDCETEVRKKKEVQNHSTGKSSQKKHPKNYEERSNFLANMFFLFFYRYGFRSKPIVSEDVCQIAEVHSAEYMLPRIKNKWSMLHAKYIRERAKYEKEKEICMQEKRKCKLKMPSQPSIVPILISLGGWRIPVSQILMVLSAAPKLVSPFLLRWLMEELSKKGINDALGIETPFPVGIVIGLILIPIFTGICESNGYRLAINVAGQMRTGVSSMIYDKTLHLNIAAQTKVDIGKLVTLISTDTQNLSESTISLLIVIQYPIMLIGAFVLLIIEVKYYSLIALVMVILVFPLQSAISAQMYKGFNRYFETNEKRLKSTNEMLQGIRMIKLSGLESVFLDRIKRVRSVQLNHVSRIVFSLQMTYSVMSAFPMFLQVVVMTAFLKGVKIADGDVMNYFYPIGSILGIFTNAATSFPMMMQYVFLLFLSSRRVSEFLMLEEHKDNVNEETGGEDKGKGEKGERSVIDSNEEDSEYSVIIENGTFKWAEPPAIPLMNEEKQYLEKEAKKREKEEKEEMKRKEKELKKQQKKGKGSEPKASKMNEEKAESVIAMKNEQQMSSTTASTSSSQSSSSSSSEALSEEANTETALKSSNTLSDIELKVKKGELLMVVGAVGSGKSSLLAAISGDIEKGGNDVEVRNNEKNDNEKGNETMKKEAKVKVKGKLSVFSQIPWIFSGTCKENILFDNEMIDDRYNECVSVCCLDPDFAVFGAGDETAIGEKGINMSGGQKARLQLARCVYSDADVVLLDDPLSAVDANVGKKLFEDCIVGLLKEKRKATVILATNQVQYADKVDNVVVMEGGRILARGTKKELEDIGIDLMKLESEWRKKTENEKNKESEKDEEMENIKDNEKMKSEEMERNEQQTENTTEGREEEANNSEKMEAICEEMKSSVQTVENSLIVAESKADSSAMSSSSSASFSSECQPASDNESSLPVDDAETEEGATEEPKAESSEAQNAASQMMTEEEQMLTSVPFRIYLDYLLNMAPVPLIICYLLLLVVCEAVNTLNYYWMNVISSTYIYPSLGLDWKLGIMAFIATAFVLFAVLRAWTFTRFVKRANNKIHDELATHVAGCPPVFFDTTPIGRILNRFSTDITKTDSDLPSTFTYLLQMWLGVVGTAIVGGIDWPYFLAFVAVILVLLHVILLTYPRTSRNLTRLEGITRSPVIARFTETATGSGLSTIRIGKKEDVWMKRFQEDVNLWASVFILVREGLQWVNLLLSGITSLFTVGVTLFGWYFMKASSVGLAVYASNQLTWQSSMLITMGVQVESNMTNLERVKFYSKKLPQETKKVEVEPDANWPSEGQIEYENVSFRYRKGLPLVLKDVSFKIKGGEKIGVCGRTGAGKTSIIQALFRLVELDQRLSPQSIDINTGLPVEGANGSPKDNGKSKKKKHSASSSNSLEEGAAVSPDEEEHNSGRIMIDGVDISKVALRRLRRSMAIIPQDPTLFEGTVRSNLDIEEKHDDEELWKVLDLVEMGNVARQMESGLNAHVAEGGANLSCGQRQLLCLARAILDECKIVVLDEATANVDAETDSKIQHTIRTSFAGQTAIIIAHRLNTIVECDRILVMDNGKVKEMDTPQALMKDQNSLFSQLLSHSGVIEKGKTKNSEAQSSEGAIGKLKEHED
ncbi:putative Multidrug Resistance Associated Protein (MRP) [Monocercomonoides exilis]|uniref:putative Multidrug Resistance Associated Protein (MRP) n=1 Tax=Monocercomonoides exilis TaxID=2049356 RepID=UPI003559D365|nr:putative Multidrug Resistance Associated Protein (MRP) [Monocercomonoides exilis]|eukprot:MONOS_276.1-p1 / transcript=MONOS_276.1 / gene=MONOS_276 / organism=Monocercomonoides_exilis_PA203 / gene_product=Multidrug Resistance Associated Protein (MRP) / transcript_product=Multidrug Resistance Associated Protein (MRP) / location=Mono_scaffold00004:270324-275228(+) / protein_length=1635 / sequence_SO=supercontig / SO=protein_coding / is_pseudo=false